MKPAVAHFVDGRLFSPTFNDYYAAQDPVAECYYVHIQPAKLLTRMRVAQTFTIFELGFGAGINFLTISSEFRKQAGSDARLRYISCDAFPLPHSTVQEAQKRVKIDTSLAQEFSEFYPPLVSGIYRQIFANDQIELTLIFSHAATAIREFLAQDSVGVDSWILDGFAPDRNPQMWDAELISTLPHCTKANGTLTTFSSAGHVRRVLEQNGFAVRKVEDTPFKRHTTLATLTRSNLRPVQPPTKITIVGGGFAGTATARALARRGVQVQLMTPTGTVGDATSGIPTAVLHPRLSASMEVPAYFRTQTYFYSVALMSRLLGNPASGAVQIKGKNMSASRLKDISNMLGEIWAKSLNSAEFREITGMEYDQEAAFFPRSLVVNGRDMCGALANHPHIEVISKELHSPIEKELVVYATGSGILLGPLTESWEVLMIEGQLDVFSQNNITTMPRQVLIQDGYIVPVKSGCAVGSTYEYTRWKPGAATTNNLHKLRDATQLQNWIHEGTFRGNRTVTSDKLPIIGQVRPNLWVNLAHGSAGTSSAPYCAELVASQITQELAPLWRECSDVLNPNRFKERQSRRPNPLQHRRLQIS